MVQFFTTTLLISIVGLSGLLFAKRYELKRNRLVLGRMRPAVDRFFHVCLMFFERILPALAIHVVYTFLRALRTGAHRTLAWVVLRVEGVLEKLLHTVRSRTQAPTGGGEASSFLREIADHKRKLLTRSKSDRIILDE